MCKWFPLQFDNDCRMSLFFYWIVCIGYDGILLTCLRSTSAGMVWSMMGFEHVCQIRIPHHWPLHHSTPPTHKWNHVEWNRYYLFYDFKNVAFELIFSSLLYWPNQDFHQFFSAIYRTRLLWKRGIRDSSWDSNCSCTCWFKGRLKIVLLTRPKDMLSLNT